MIRWREEKKSPWSSRFMDITLMKQWMCRSDPQSFSSIKYFVPMQIGRHILWDDQWLKYIDILEEENGPIVGH